MAGRYKHYKRGESEYRPCNDCHRYLALNEENFYRHKSGAFMAVCKECKRAYKRNYDLYKKIKVISRIVGG